MTILFILLSISFSYTYSMNEEPAPNSIQESLKGTTTNYFAKTKHTCAKSKNLIDKLSLIGRYSRYKNQKNNYNKIFLSYTLLSFNYEEYISITNPEKYDYSYLQLIANQIEEIHEQAKYNKNSLSLVLSYYQQI